MFSSTYKVINYFIFGDTQSIGVAINRMLTKIIYIIIVLLLLLLYFWLNDNNFFLQISQFTIKEEFSAIFQTGHYMRSQTRASQKTRPLQQLFFQFKIWRLQNDKRLHQMKMNSKYIHNEIARQVFLNCEKFQMIFFIIIHNLHNIGQAYNEWLKSLNKCVHIFKKRFM